jgi:HAD superfamily phosphoserine phosphatase-like hydrolase
MASLQGLVVFDLDGTLLRGLTVCEVLAAQLGRVEETQRFEALTGQTEIAAARIEMARWYNNTLRTDLIESLQAVQWAPGAVEGVSRLREAGIHVAIASITWDFAVSWVAGKLGVRHFLGTELEDDGNIRHVWPEDKAGWVARLATQLQIPSERIAAVGDSAGDAPMLRAAALPLFVGMHAPAEPSFLLRPNADILVLAREILSTWGVGSY